MKQLPRDPFAFQARVFDALCQDLFDIGARRSTGLDRTNALRQVSISTRDGRVPNKPLPVNNGK